MWKTKPYIFLQKWFTDADYLISVEWNKLHKEYLIDCLRWWNRELSYFKIEWDDIYVKPIEVEREDEQARYCKFWFKSYYTVRNWIFVEEQPKHKYEDRDDLEFNYFEEKWARKKLLWKETEWFIDNSFTEPAKTYIIYHALWKEKAKEYGEKAIKKLSTKSLMKYKEKLENFYNKYWTKLVYDWPESVSFCTDLLTDKEMNAILDAEEKVENFDLKRILWNIEEIKLIMENWNVPECEKRTFNFKKDAIEFAEDKEYN